MPFRVGEIVEAKSASEDWAEAQVLQFELEEDEALVRFKSKGSWHDEWVSLKHIRKFTGSSTDKIEMRQKFKIGEKVMAKWTNQVRPYPAEILSYDINTDSYQIRFYDGFIKTYKSSRIQKMTRADRERLALDPPPPPVLEPVNRSVFDTSGIGTKEERRARKRKLDVISLFRPNARGMLDEHLSDRSDSPSSQVSIHSERKRSRTESLRSCSPVAGPSRRRSIQPVPVSVPTTGTPRHSLGQIEDLERASRRERTRKFSVVDLFSPYKKSPSKVESAVSSYNPRTYSKQGMKVVDVLESVRKTSPVKANVRPIISDRAAGESLIKSSTENLQEKTTVKIQQRAKTVEVCIVDDEAEVEILDDVTAEKQPLSELPLPCSSSPTETSDVKPDSIAKAIIQTLRGMHEELIDQKRAVSQPNDLIGQGCAVAQPADSNSDGESDIIVLSDGNEDLEELHDEEVSERLDTQSVAKDTRDSSEVSEKSLDARIHKPTSVIEQCTSSEPVVPDASAGKGEETEEVVKEKEEKEKTSEVNKTSEQRSQSLEGNDFPPPSSSGENVPLDVSAGEANKDIMLDSTGLPERPKQVTIQQIIVRRNGQEALGQGQQIQDIELTSSKKMKVPHEIFLQDTNLPPGWMKKATRCTSGNRKWSVTVIGPCGTKFKSRRSIASFLEAQGLSYPISCFNFSLGADFIRHFNGRSHEAKKEKNTQERPSIVSKLVSQTSQFLPTPNDFLCPGRMCNKSFRSAMLLHMHIKHQHPDLSKADIKLPKVSDLAYARTAGEEDPSKTRGETELPSSSFSASFKEFLSRREENLVREVCGGSSFDADGESSNGMVVEAVEENDDLVHCVCGYNEEDGLMIQCDICLCWQHGVCFGILTEEEVPDHFRCSFCINPKKVRASMRVAYDENWLKDGKLARFSFVDKKNEHANPKRVSLLRKAHSAMAETLDIGNFLQKLSKKVEIAKNKDHPKLYLWAGVGGSDKVKEEQKKDESSQSRLDEMPVTASQEAADFLMEELPEDAFDTSFLESSDIVALLPTSSELEQMTNELNPKGVPQAEARINNDDCRKNLITHINESHSIIERRLEMLEKLADMLEKDSAPTPYARKNLQRLMKDVAELSLLSSFS